MSNKLRIVIAQLNMRVGDIQGNLEKHLHSAMKARDNFSADIIVFPELSLTGYPPEDLLLRPAFISEANEALKKFTTDIKNIYCFVGHPHLEHGNLFNACSVIYNGKILITYSKQCLPNYGVFDECRYFTPGEKTCVFNIKEIPIGLIICEDLWKLRPTHKAALKGAKIIICPNASPFEKDKHEQRLSVLAKRARYNDITIVYANLLGGQDELVFDGGSMVVNSKGELTQFAGFFNETLFAFDVDASLNTINVSDNMNISQTEERVYQALVLALRDYVEKNHIPGVLIGVSGGIDSALTLTIAVDALQKDRVKAIILPSRFTSDISLTDAKELTKNLGVATEIISIEDVYQSFLDTMAKSFTNIKPDVTEENIQARCRQVILMALSNKYGQIVLATGNRSELAVGYCTLYGDMAGGFAVLKDVSKTWVYKLTHHRNQKQFVIPERIIDRPPTAELAFDQKDEDSLPPYSILDPILYYYLNQLKSIEEIVAKGFDRETVVKVVKLIKYNEYKRRQSPIGPHIDHKSFIKDWRYPVTNGFKG